MINSFRQYIIRTAFFLLLILACKQDLFSQFHAECTCNPILSCANITVITKHYIQNHPTFGVLTPIDTNCANVEFWPVIRVTADGTKATQIELINVKCCSGGNFELQKRDFLVLVDEEDQPVYNGQPEMYGKLIFEDHYADRTIYTYQHPTILPENGEIYRYINVKILQASNVNPAFGVVYGRMRIEVLRPPIVFIHGLWSDASAFDDMAKQLKAINEYEPYEFFQSDYSSGNASSFAYNQWVVRNGINTVISECADNRLSVGKANLVVHSMGGLLSRLYIQGPTYHDRQDVNRLITCNTPHSGSQMANFLLDQSQYGNYVAQMLGNLGMDCYGGAVDNLRVNSSQIQDVQTGVIPDNVHFHSLITVEPRIASYANLVATVMSFFPASGLAPSMLAECTAAFVDDIFDFDDHDLVVAAESQSGGLNGLATNTVQFQQHTGSVANVPVILNVQNLLNEGFNSPSYADQYPIKFVQYDLDFPCLPFNGENVDASRAASALNITSPASGSSVIAGNTISVFFTSSMLDSVSIMMRYKPDSIALIANSASAGNVIFNVPENLYGKYPLVAVGIGADKKIKVLDSIQLNIVSSAALDSIIITPDILYLDQHDSSTYRILGKFSDGIYRNLTSDASLSFDFVFDHASRQGAFIHLNEDAGDTLRVSMLSIVSNPMTIRKTGNTYLPGCKLVTNTNDTGFGSLRYAIDCAKPSDTIKFVASLQGDTIHLTSDMLNLTKSIHIINSNATKIYIRTNTSPRVFRIFSGIEAWLENLNIISGTNLVAAISNSGELTLKNVFLNNPLGGNSTFINNENGTVKILGQCNLK